MSVTHIEECTDRVGDRLTDVCEDIVAEELRRMRTEAPDFFASDDPHYVDSYTASCRAHLAVLLDGLRGGRDVPAALPASACEEIRAVAEWGIALDALVQTYRTAHAVIWEFAYDIAIEHVPEAHRPAVVKVISRYLFAYTDQMINLISAIYQRELLALHQDRNKQRRQLVRDLLDGLPIDHARLPYTLGVTHVAAIASSEDISRQVAHMAMTAGVSSLTVPGPSGTTWIWFGGNALEQPTCQQRLLESVPQGLEVAFGEPATGVEGFRISHMEARQACRMARKAHRPVVRYSEIALLSLATSDEPMALHFMRRELGCLALNEPRIKELRDTLKTYFACGHNASTTAAKMLLNDRTVAYRLRSIEQKLGHPVLERREELAVALQLLDLFGPTSAIPSSPASEGLRPATE